MARLKAAESVNQIPLPSERRVMCLQETFGPLGLGKTAGYQLAAKGDYPVPTFKVGNRYRVLTADLRELLGLDRPECETTAAEK